MSKIIKKQDITVLIESTLREAGIDPNVVKKQVTSVNGEEPSDEEMANIRSAIQMDNDRKSSKKTIKKESYFRFNQEGPWMDVDDYSYDELPENDYEDVEYNTYDEFVKDYPKHKHFQGYRNPETSTTMFDRYKQEYGPLKGKRLKNMNMGESKSNNKTLINEDFQKEMDRFKKLTNYTFKK